MQIDKFPQRKPTRWSEINYSTEGFYFLTISSLHRKQLFPTIAGAPAPLHVASSDIGDTPVGGGTHDAPRPILTTIGQIVEKHLLASNKIKDLAIEQYVIMAQPHTRFGSHPKRSTTITHRDVEGAVPYTKCCKAYARQ